MNMFSFRVDSSKTPYSMGIYNLISLKIEPLKKLSGQPNEVKWASAGRSRDLHVSKRLNYPQPK